MKKKQTKIETTWNLTHIYKNKKEWENAFEELTKNTENLKNLIDIALKDENLFKEYIEKKLEVELEIEKVYCYPKRHYDIELNNPEYKTMMDKALDINKDIEALDGLFQKRIIERSSLVKKYLESPSLSKHRKYIEKILEKGKHVPTDETRYAEISKELFDLKNGYRLIIDKIPPQSCIIGGETCELTNLNFVSLKGKAKTSEDRRSIFLARQERFKSAAKRASTILKSRFEKELSLAKICNFDSVLENRMYRFDLPENTVYKLIDSITSHLDLLHRFNFFKKDSSGLEEFHLYDVSTATSKAIKMTFEEAIEHIKVALAPLGEEYISRIDMMLEEGWIDVYPKEHKLPSASTSMTYIGKPYVLMNFDETLFSARTLAHEIGHALYSSYMRENTEFEYFLPASLLSETVAKVNEFLFNDYLLKITKDKEEKKTILKNILEALFNSLFNQIRFTEFEDSIYKKIKRGEVVDDTVLSDMYLGLIKKYHGEAFTYDEEQKYDWVNLHQLVTQDTYYLYQYSLSAATAMDIVTKIQSGDKAFLEKYKKFLTLDSTVSVIDSFKVIDIDLENGNYVENAISNLKSMLEELIDLN